MLKVLRKLTALGNTVLVIEHNLDVIRASDWVIDMGPEGGDEGGRILAQGTPAEVANNPDSVTGPYLLRMLSIQAKETQNRRTDELAHNE